MICFFFLIVHNLVLCVVYTLFLETLRSQLPGTSETQQAARGTKTGGRTPSGGRRVVNLPLRIIWLVAGSALLTSIGGTPK